SRRATGSLPSAPDRGNRRGTSARQHDDAGRRPRPGTPTEDASKPCAWRATSAQRAHAPNLGASRGSSAARGVLVCLKVAKMTAATGLLLVDDVLQHEAGELGNQRP